MPKTLIDTDILLEIIRKKNPNVVAAADAYLADFGRYTVSALTVMEVVRGLQRQGHSDEIAPVLQTFAAADVLPFDFETAELAGRIYGDLERAGLPIGRIDPLIAATAVRHGLTLATGNARHFERVRRLGYPLGLEDWRQPPTTEAAGA